MAHWTLLAVQTRQRCALISVNTKQQTAVSSWVPNLRQKPKLSKWGRLPDRVIGNLLLYFPLSPILLWFERKYWNLSVHRSYVSLSCFTLRFSTENEHRRQQAEEHCGLKGGFQDHQRNIRALEHWDGAGNASDLRQANWARRQPWRSCAHCARNDCRMQCSEQRQHQLERMEIFITKLWFFKI